MISIAAKLRPFSRRIGAQCIIPGTDAVIEAFPHFLRIGSIEIPLKNDPWLLDFTLQQDLEKNCVWVFGKKFRIKVTAAPDGFLVGDRFFPADVRFQRPGEIERLSLGCHKAQDWDLVSRRLDPKEFLPTLYLLSQKVPCEKQAAIVSDPWEVFYLSSFHHMMVPREKGVLGSAFSKIRSLFVQEAENLIQLLPKNPFPEGRFLNLQMKMAVLDMEWSKRMLKKVILYPKKTGEIFLDLPQEIRSFRWKLKPQDKGVLQDKKDPLQCTHGQCIYLDRFHQ